jgi:hypothetical protein
MASIFTPTNWPNVFGPYAIDVNDCIGDSVGIINANTNYLASYTAAVSGTTNVQLSLINSLSSTLVNSNAGAVVIFQDQKPSDTDGGTPGATDTWIVRTLNTKAADSDNLCANPLSNTFTLPAGTWHIQASAPAYRVNHHRIRLYNTSDNIATALGTSTFAGQSQYYAVENRSFVDTVVTFTTPKNFRIEHQVDRNQSTDGFGVATNTGNVELYTTVTCTKIR